MVAPAVTSPGTAHHAPPPAAAQPGRQAGTPIPGLVGAYGVYLPLSMLDPTDVLMGGYGWLDPTDGGATPHPGVDLNSPHGGSGTGCNADEGLPVVAPVAGVVRATIFWDGSTPGEGNHCWIELDAPEQSWTGATTWLHVDHLKMIYCGVGGRLAAGDPIGTCGRSGGWDCAHLHCELARARPASWWQWPYGWSRAQVEAAYYSPVEWFRATVTLAGAMHGGGTQEMAILSGAQQAAIATALFAPYPFNPDTAIGGGWLAEWRAGRYRGPPTAEEQDVPEDTAAGKPKGRFQPFELGCGVWLPGAETASWDG
jgi:murein DD-endopeptidase MepM/ murein hydrolase activator NlpD